MICSFILSFLTLSLYSAGLMHPSSFFESDKATEQEQYNTRDIQIDGDFSNSEVLIVIKHEFSLNGKTFSKEDFPEIAVENVKDLTPRGENEYNKDKFNKILDLTLLNKTKESVLETINKLKSNKLIQCADFVTDRQSL